MNVFGLLFALVTSTLLLLLPRRWAPFPLLLATLYISHTRQLEIGPAHFSVIRILIVVGLVRVMMKGERVAGGIKSLDRMMILWAVWDVCSLAFHNSDELIFRLGLLYDALGVYYLCRVFIVGLGDITTVFKVMCILMVPLSATMLVERLQGSNPLALIGFDTGEGVLTTKGHFRAAGAFGHPILAGTLGAICLAMALYSWRQNRKVALIGVFSSLCIIYASGSSGPIITAFSTLVAMAIWKFRRYLRALRWFAVGSILTLNVVMNEPIYYLIGRIDITGGSTGYYRAQLIQYAIEHFGQWGLAGTDSTLGWTDVAIDKSSSDITSHYIRMGVWGGLPLMLIFIITLNAGFAAVGRGLKFRKNSPTTQQFLIWTLGCILFGHTVATLSICYFDQSFVFLYLVLAMVASIDVGAAVSSSACDQRGAVSLSAV